MKKIKEKQINRIKELFKTVSEIGGRDRRESRLRILCQKIAGVLDLCFLNEKQARKVISKLRAWQQRKSERYGRAEKILLHRLSARQRETIRREYPFRSKRNELIRLLRSQGISRPLLAKVSGLCRTSIHNILNEKRRCGDDSKRKKIFKRL